MHGDFMGIEKNMRSSYIDNLKSLLIFFVVIGHFAEAVLSQSDVFKSMFIWLYFFHMPLFIFISGFLSKRLTQNKERTLQKSFEYFTLYLIMKFTLSLVKSFCTGKEIAFSLFSETSVPWYLFAMILMYLTSYALRNINQKLVFCIFVVLALFVGYDKEVRDFFVLSRFIVFYPFFILGLNCTDDALKKLKHQKFLVPFAIIVILGSIAVAYLYPDIVYEFRPMLTARNPYTSLNEPLETYGPLCRLFVYIVGSVIGLATLIITPKLNLGYLSKVGARTLPIFFFHRQILWVFDKIDLYNILQEKLGSFGGNAIWLLLGVLLTFILSIKIFEVPFTWWHNQLFKKIKAKK